MEDFQILEMLDPPTKVLRKFLRTWADREKTRSQYSTTTTTQSSIPAKGPTEVTLSISRRLIALAKVKNILNIEAGLDMIALAMAISSEVRWIETHKKTLLSFIYIYQNDGVFPEMAIDVKNVLRRFEFIS